MKRYLLFLASFLSVMGLHAKMPDWAEFDRYADSNRELRAAHDNGGKVVLFGNSITDSWATMRPAFFSENGLIGRGISGQTTYQFLSRFREDVVSLNPGAVVINAGINDIAENTHAYDEERTFGNIISMVEIAQANGIRVYLSSVLPAVGFKWNRNVTDAPMKIMSLNRRIEEYAESHGIPYIDYYTALLAPEGRGIKDGHSLDGLHPNEKGYEIMEGILLQYLQSGCMK